jgi:nitroreductase
MDLFQAIRTRRSIRKFRPDPVPASHVQELLYAAMMAPSAGNQQPWQFVVITDRSKLDAIIPIHGYAAMAAHAPMAILVCGDLSLEKFAGFWIQDCSAAMQNLLLAAHAKGLGAVWCGVYPVEKRVEGFKSLFHLPEHVMPLGLAVMGWPAHTPESKSRFRPERVHDNVW